MVTIGAKSSCAQWKSSQLPVTSAVNVGALVLLRLKDLPEHLEASDGKDVSFPNKHLCFVSACSFSVNALAKPQ